MRYILNCSLLNTYMNNELDTLIAKLSSDTYGDAPADETLLVDLSSGFAPLPREAPPEPFKITEETVGDYVLQKTGSLIETSLEAVQDLKNFIVQGQNPDEIAALASLITSTTGAIETLNKLYLMRKKHDMNKEIKSLDWANKKEVSKSLPATQITNNTNVLMASREEIIKKMLEIETVEDVECVETTLISNDLVEEIYNQDK